jgi:FixJ family two-component response regulator
LTESATVFVVDDDASVRRALGRLLSSAGFRVELFSSATAFLARESHSGVGCLILDIHMPEMSGTELQNRLAEMQRYMPIVFLTAYGDVPTSVSAMKQGAVDFLTKPVDEQAMIAAIEDALHKHQIQIEEWRYQDAVRERVELLTAREHQVMCYVIGGALNKQVASALGISEKTVKAHRGEVMRKMAVTSVAALVRACEKVGIEPQQL